MGALLRTKFTNFSKISGDILTRGAILKKGMFTAKFPHVKKSGKYQQCDVIIGIPRTFTVRLRLKIAPCAIF